MPEYPAHLRLKMNNIIDKQKGFTVAVTKEELVTEFEQLHSRLADAMKLVDKVDKMVENPGMLRILIDIKDTIQRFKQGGK